MVVAMRNLKQANDGKCRPSVLGAPDCAGLAPRSTIGAGWSSVFKVCGGVRVYHVVLVLCVRGAAGLYIACICPLAASSPLSMYAVVPAVADAREGNVFLLFSPAR